MLAQVYCVHKQSIQRDATMPRMNPFDCVTNLHDLSVYDTPRCHILGVLTELKRERERQR